MARTTHSATLPRSMGEITQKIPHATLTRKLDVMSRDVVLAPARNDTVPIQEVSVQTACH
ncbi:hypothetical protein D9R16_00545 [Corynebacterium diphtheriae]|nr:hypothetical protein BXA20_09460 [Corynebacterium diphtheriae]RLP17849.1 hypothetical protein D9R16_00545 [Corynebacterium diphtheriae]